MLMLEFAQKCLDEGVITESLFEKIKKENNINVKDDLQQTLLHLLCKRKDVDALDVEQALSFGALATEPDKALSTPFMYAIANGRKDLYDLLKTQGEHDYQAVSIYSDNLVTLALLGGNKDILRDILTKVQNPLYPNRFGRTPLHTAARFNIKTKLINILLEDARFQNIKTQPDIFGDTPEDLAARYHRQNAFDALTEKKQDIQSNPKYDVPIIDLGQTTLENKLKAYLRNQERDPIVLDAKGMCNGWAFLYQTYLPDRENEYWDMVNFVCSWDGSKESFDALTLPKSLQGKYAKRKETTSDAEDLFEQLINDVIVFFSATPGLYALKMGMGQGSRVQQFQLIESTNRTIQPVFNLGNLTLSRNQLIEQFEYMRTFPGLTIDIGGMSHQISVYITKNGNYKLFDSAMPTRMRELGSAEEVVDTIIKNKYMSQLLSNEYWVELSTYKISEKNEPKTIQREPTASTYDFSKSPNGYNALHYAVLDNDLEKVKILISSHPEFMLQPNAHDKTPLDFAFQNLRVDCFDILINSRKLEDEALDVVSKKCIATGNTELMGLLVKAQPHFHPTKLWGNIMDDNTQLPISMEVRYRQAMLLLPLVQRQVNFDVVEGNKNPPLMLTIEENHKSFFDYLLENNASFLNRDLFKSESVYSLCLAQEDDYYLKRILEKVGNKINVLDNLGNNLLHWAAIKGKADVINVLLKKQANIDEKNGDNNTPLMLAVQNDNIEIIRLLIQKGAKIDINELSLIEKLKTLDDPVITKALASIDNTSTISFLPGFESKAKSKNVVDVPESERKRPIKDD